MKSFRVDTLWDEETHVWCGHSDAIPVTTEAATADALVERVSQIAPEVLEMNGRVHGGEKIRLIFQGGHIQERIVTAD